jgi:hypothetical protein
MSRRAYAAARGVDEAAIRKAIKAGRIVPTAAGPVDPTQADRNWYHWSQAKARDHPEPRSADCLSHDYIERFLAERSPPYDGDRVVRLIEELKKEVGELRRELHNNRYTPGIAEVQHGLAKLSISLGVVFHQLVRAIEGKPLTLAPGAFEQDESTTRER